MLAFPKHPEQTNFHRSWPKQISGWHTHALHPRKLSEPWELHWHVVGGKNKDITFGFPWVRLLGVMDVYVCIYDIVEMYFLVRLYLMLQA